MARGVQSNHDRVGFTFRTSVPHRDVIDALAGQHGLSRQDFMTLWFADTMQLPRPHGVPAVQIDIAAAVQAAGEVFKTLEQQQSEVLRSA